MRSLNRHQLSRSGLFIALMTAGFFVAMAMLPLRGEMPQQVSPLPQAIFAFLPQPAGAQQRFLRIEEAAAQVYALQPDLPLENQYENRNTGRVSDRNTLISRLIRYHSYVKGRPATYRLDWKLTLADYLGANERVVASTYPGNDTLRPSPLAGDVAAINRLSRDQRDRLVQTLVDVYSAATPAESPAAPAAPVVPVPNPSPVSPAPSRPAPPSLQSPRSGDAQLLQP